MTFVFFIPLSEACFTNTLHDLHLVQGDLLDLECHVSDTISDVIWLRNAYPLRETKRLTLAKDGYHRSLVVMEATLSDAGVYTCIIVSNGKRAFCKVTVDSVYSQ